MRWLVVAAMGLVGLSLACPSAGAFVCTSDAECSRGGAGGQCELNGYCSFLDPQCASGRRFGEFAGDGLAGTCTDELPGTSGSVTTGAAGSDPTGAGTSGSEATGPSLSGGIDDSSSGTDRGSETDTTGEPPACGALGEPCCRRQLCAPGGSCVGDECQSCVATIDAGERHVCALTNGGRLDCWGANQNGQLGDGTTEDRPDAKTVAEDIVEFDAGASHVLAIDGAGQLWGWGRNNDSQVQLGQGGQVVFPLALDGVANPVAVGGGRQHSCVVDGGGALTCWGRNNDGQLGVEGLGRLTPAVVPDIAGAVDLDLGSHHTCVVAGGLRCFGRNGNDQLGNEAAPTGPDPVEVPLVADTSQVSASGNHTCVVDVDGNVWCWGRDDFGQTGDGAPGGSHGSPTAVVGMPDAIDVAAGSDHTCGLSAEGEVYCWGRNGDGQLGIDVGMAAQATDPVELTDVVDIAAGNDHTCAATASGDVYCWGRNANFALGVEGGDQPAPVLSSFICDPR